MGEDTSRMSVAGTTAVAVRVGPTPLERLLLLARGRSDWLIAGTLGVVTFLTYLWTLAPTILDQDSGRFQARAYVLSIGHPTGYPTYILLGKLFTYLPFGDVAYRVSLSSAVYATGAVILLYFVARRLTAPVPAVAAALAFAFSQTFWSQAVIAEVYTLHALFLCATLLTLLLWLDHRKDRFLLGAAFLIGLSLTNHMTSGLLIPCAVLLVAITDRRRLMDWRLLVKASGLFLLGLTPYLYLPIRAAMDPPMNYADPSSLSRFLDLVTGRRFTGQMWAFGPGELPKREAMYWVDLRQQFNFALLALAFVGLVRNFLGKRPVFAVLAVLFVGNLIYALEYDIWDIIVYFIPTHLILAIWLAFGVQALMEWLRGLPFSSLRSAATIGITTGLLFLVGLTWWTRYDAVDQRDNYHTRKLLEQVATTPRQAVIYDDVGRGLLGYMRYVERRRQDLVVRDVTRETVLPLLEQDLQAGHKVYLLNKSLEKTLTPEYLPIESEEGLWRVVRNTPRDVLLATPEFTAAAEWLKSNGSSGNIITNPRVDEALRALGINKVLSAATPAQLQDPTALPPSLQKQARDVQHVLQVAGSRKTRVILNKYNVRRLVLVKKFPPGLQDRDQVKVKWSKYSQKPERYSVAYESENVIIYEVKQAP